MTCFNTRVCPRSQTDVWRAVVEIKKNCRNAGMSSTVVCYLITVN